ncbi:PHD finger protein 7 isoform X1 [Hydra vulgaris]|uniref:PHD finger protein 7 isoform X1 n=1 Tax=Hydra vulgaris TaxID=6087 RepID=UPI001F5FCA56|nr:PHD finger protein 7 [Hydra vulgaris]
MSDTIGNNVDKNQNDLVKPKRKRKRGRPLWYFRRNKKQVCTTDVITTSKGAILDVIDKKVNRNCQLQPSNLRRKRKRKGRTSWCRKKRVLVQNVVHTTSTECCFCGESENSEYGTFFQSKESNIAAHQFCLFFSAGLPQNGDDAKGFDGFLFTDIVKEVQRCFNITCKICHKKGASSGCSVPSCQSVYHFKCGLKSGIQYVFKDAFDSYCLKHRSKQDLRRIKSLKPAPKCPICFDEILEIDHNEILKAPCCKDMFIHRSCIKMQANVSGYFFRCPTCNNSNDFIEEMSSRGIFIPKRDAGWEENGAFAELLEKYNRCDLLYCLCKKGRSYCTKAGKWHLLACYLCGQSAIHVKCLARHYIPGIGYVCKDCNQVVRLRKTDPNCCQNTYMSRLKEHKKRLNELTLRNDPVLLASSVFAAQFWRNKFGIKDCKVMMTNFLDDSNHLIKKKLGNIVSNFGSGNSIISKSLTVTKTSLVDPLNLSNFNRFASADQHKIVYKFSFQKNILPLFCLPEDFLGDNVVESNFNIQLLSKYYAAVNSNKQDCYKEEKNKITFYSQNGLVDCQNERASNRYSIEQNCFDNFLSKEFCDVFSPELTNNLQLVAKYNL